MKVNETLSSLMRLQWDWLQYYCLFRGDAGASVEALADYIFNQLVMATHLNIEGNGVVHDIHAGVTRYSNCILQHLLQSEFEKAKKVLMDLFAQSNPQPGSVHVLWTQKTFHRPSDASTINFCLESVYKSTVTNARIFCMSNSYKWTIGNISVYQRSICSVNSA